VAVTGRERFWKLREGKAYIAAIMEGVESATRVDLMGWVVQSDKIIF
jgi:hypothetical protein